jgi:hypothetical protein
MFLMFPFCALFALAREHRAACFALIFVALASIRVVFAPHVAVWGGDFAWSINLTGKCLFYKTYLENGIRGKLGDGPPPISRDNGPASAELIDRLTEYIDQNGTYEWMERTDPGYEYFFGRHKGSPQSQVAAFCSEPIQLYRSMIEAMLEASVGPVETNRLLGDVAKEMLARNPMLMPMWVTRNLKGFFLGPAIVGYGDSLERQHRLLMAYEYSPFLLGKKRDDMKQLSPLMAEQVAYRLPSSLESIISFSESAYKYFRPAIFLLMLAGLPLTLYFKRTRGMGFVCLLYIFYGSFTICLLQPPIPRYILQVFPVEILMAAAGGSLLLREGWLWRSLFIDGMSFWKYQLLRLRWALGFLSFAFSQPR